MSRLKTSFVTYSKNSTVFFLNPISMEQSLLFVHE